MPKASTTINTQRNANGIALGPTTIQNSSQNTTEEFNGLRLFLAPASKMAPRGLREAPGTRKSLKINKKTTSQCHFFACFSGFVSTYVVEHVKMLTQYAHIAWGSYLGVRR